MFYMHSQSTCEVSIIPTLQLRNWGLERFTKILSLNEGSEIQNSRALALKLYDIKKTIFLNLD